VPAPGEIAKRRAVAFVGDRLAITPFDNNLPVQELPAVIAFLQPVEVAPVDEHLFLRALHKVCRLHVGLGQGGVPREAEQRVAEGVAGQFVLALQSRDHEVGEGVRTALEGAVVHLRFGPVTVPDDPAVEPIEPAAVTGQYLQDRQAICAFDPVGGSPRLFCHRCTSGRDPGA